MSFVFSVFIMFCPIPSNLDSECQVSMYPLVLMGPPGSSQTDAAQRCLDYGQQITPPPAFYTREIVCLSEEGFKQIA